MGPILHILKDSNCKEALKLIEQQAALQSQEFTILLIQDAVKLRPSIKAKIYVLQEDAEARGVTSPFEAVDYEKMLEMILAADRVMAW